MTPRILNAESNGYCSEAREILNGLGTVDYEDLHPGELADRIPGYHVLVVRLRHRIDRRILDRAGSLRVIVTATTGLDHIDLAQTGQRGIAVLSLNGETEFLRGIRATAEHTWALLLTLVRRVPWAFDDVLRGRWRRDSYRGVELYGKRLGIIGLGRVGRQVAGFAKAFGMTISAYDSSWGSCPAWIQRDRSLESLLSHANVLSIHVPLDRSTRHLLNMDRLSMLPKGAVIVNTSRGAVIDEEALLSLLESGHIGAAALDVVESEPAFGPEDHVLVYASAHANLLITPHLGGSTLESMSRTEVFMAKKLRAFFLRADQSA